MTAHQGQSQSQSQGQESGPPAWDAVLWDMDGTLVNSEPLHFAATTAVLRDAGVLGDAGVPHGLHETLVGRSVAACYGILRQRFGLLMTQDAFVAQKTAAYLKLAPDVGPRDGAVALFQALRDAGARQAVVSNSDRLLVDANLRAVGLAVPDLTTVSRNDVRSGKPDPEPFLRAAWLLGADPLRCVVVEDSATGVQAGLAAGMRVLAWPEPGSAVADFPPGAEIVGTAGALRTILAASVTSAFTNRIIHVP